MNKKMYPMYLKGLTAVFSMAVASTLIGCQQANPQNQNTNNQNTETTQEENYSEMKDYLQTQQEKDTKAEAAISMMLDGVEVLKNKAEESANSEEVQYQLSEAMKNFQVLTDFIFNGGEIDGVTFSELSEDGKESVKKRSKHIR